MPVKRGGKKGGETKRSVDEGTATRNGGPAREGTVPTAEWIGTHESSLDQEVAYYLAHLPEWGLHGGEHVLIHGQAQFGFFPTRDAALEEGFRRFGRVAFLVKQIAEEEPRSLVGIIL